MPTTPRPRPAPTDRPVPPTRRDERASALVLVPTMVLVLLCLAGIAIDLSLLHGAHRGAHRVVSAAADDAAAMIDQELLQLTGELRVDPVAARRVATAQLATMSLPGRQVGPVEVTVAPDGATVSVRVTVEIDHVVLRALPGRPDHQQFDIVAHGRLLR